LIFQLRKLIILYNKFGKAAEQRPPKTAQFAVSRESIRLFCDASLDYLLHLDDDSMKAISARPISATSSCTA
jgi:hypothetical protein